MGNAAKGEFIMDRPPSSMKDDSSLGGASSEVSSRGFCVRRVAYFSDWNENAPKLWFCAIAPYAYTVSQWRKLSSPTCRFSKRGRFTK